MTDQLVAALDDLRRAIEFLDKVKTASSEEKIAIGQDHHDWLEQAARSVVNAAFSRRVMTPISD